MPTAASAATSSSTSPGLALTGSHTIVLGLYAAAFLTSGVVFALAARRRR